MTVKQLATQELQICEAVESAFESKQIPWLQRLVNQPSHTNATDDVEAVATIIDELAAEIGMSRTRHQDPDGKYADHRVFSTPATGADDSTIVLSGHCDTVYPRSSGFLEFRRDDMESPSNGDHIFGPGVLDMKSGLTVILFGLRALSEAAPDIFGRLKLRFICNTDEEVGSPSSRNLFQEMANRTTEAMVFEAGRDEDRIVTARKGTGAFVLSVIGSEAHAGNEHAAGANAIHGLAYLIPHVESLTNYEMGTTVNVGIITGGTARNTVPGNAECQIDVRVSTLDQMQHVQTKLTEISTWSFEGSETVPAKIRETKVVLSGGISRPPMETTTASQDLRQRYEIFADKMGLMIGVAPMQGGGSDANNFSAHGVPTIDGLGPYGKFMHSPREWCSLSSLKKRTAALACFLASE